MPQASGRARSGRLAIATTATLALAGVIGPAAALSAGSAKTQTFATPGIHAFAVPKNVTHITVTAIGAGGGACDPTGLLGATGGEGASTVATVAVKPGSTLIVGVGGVGGACFTNGAGGANGGGAGGQADVPGEPSAGGGGASGVLVSATKPLVVAGGGGGAGYCGGNGGNADSAGMTASPCPGFASDSGGGGGAGTALSGGSGGAAGDSNATKGADGTVEFGGAGGNGDSTGPSVGGGGGGGGLHGGGGGGGGGIFSGSGGGGGGASFVLPSATGVTAPSATTDAAEVTITYTAVAKPAAVTKRATGVKSKSATVHGSVNGHGLKTTYWFQWGTSKHYGHKTGSHSLKASSSAKSVAALLSGLKPGTTYHFRWWPRARRGRRMART